MKEKVSRRRWEEEEEEGNTTGKPSSNHQLPTSMPFLSFYIISPCQGASQAEWKTEGDVRNKKTARRVWPCCTITLLSWRNRDKDEHTHLLFHQSVVHLSIHFHISNKSHTVLDIQIHTLPISDVKPQNITEDISCPCQKHINTRCRHTFNVFVLFCWLVLSVIKDALLRHRHNLEQTLLFS